ncbi:MAG: lactate racemase domain-containing protein [Phycisphaerae bacterium]
MADISVPWDRGELSIALPENWTVRQVAEPELRPAPDDWPVRLARALTQPDSGLPLGKLLTARKNGRIAILLEDVTRHSPLPQVLEPILRELKHSGISPEQVELFFCTGMHPAMTKTQVREKIGDLADQYAWRSNPWHIPEDYVRVGTVDGQAVRIDRRIAEADLRIVVSSVSPHLQAGFGGGYKMFLPGCASLETIRLLHRRGLGRKARQRVGIGAARNHMRAFIEAAGGLVDACHGKTFAVQYLLDGNNLPTSIVAGDAADTQEMLTKQCSVSCGVVVSEPADVVITNAYPRDYDLWQSFKGVANAQWAARPGGVIICLTHCPAGMEDMNPPKWPVSPAWTRRVLRVLKPAALSSLITRLVPSLAGDAAFFVRMGLQTIHRNPVMFVSPTLAEQGPFPAVDIFARFDQASAATRRILGEGPQRVVVFPQGGITYPIPRPQTIAPAV